MSPASTPLSGCSPKRSDQIKSFKNHSKPNIPGLTKLRPNCIFFYGFLWVFYGFSMGCLRLRLILRVAYGLKPRFPIVGLSQRKNYRNTLIANNTNFWSGNFFLHQIIPPIIWNPKIDIPTDGGIIPYRSSCISTSLRISSQKNMVISIILQFQLFYLSNRRLRLTI